MQIPKPLLLLTAAVLSFAASSQAQRADSDLQTKAREQLREKMVELDSQQQVAPAAAAPAPKPAKTAAPTKTKAPPAAPAKTIAPAAAAVPAAAATVPPVVIAPAPPPKPAPAPAKTATVAPATHGFEDLPNSDNPDAQAKAEAAMHQTMTELDAAHNPSASAPAKSTAPVNTAKAAPAAASAPKPTAPPTLQPGSKEAKLAELLVLYKADKITPQQYHEQRAKILAGQ
jgi:hypothetical protein